MAAPPPLSEYVPSEIVARLSEGMIVRETQETIIFEKNEKQLCALQKNLPETAPLPPGPDVPSNYYDALAEALNDPLAERLLASGEPDMETIAGLLAPLLGPAFVGDEAASERMSISRAGALEKYNNPPVPPLSALRSVGLLDGWLPVICHVYDTNEGRWEQIVFATAGPGGELQVWRRLRQWAQTSGKGMPCTTRTQCNGDDVDTNTFYAALWELWRYWRGFRKQGLRLRLPEKPLQKMAQAMLIWSVLTFRGLKPRYGMGAYDQPQHHSFPPATLFLAQALLAWGHLERAGDVLAHYISRYVKPDGTFDYYGPAVAEYGQFLTLIAEYVRLTQDTEWLRRRLTMLRPVWQRLLKLRGESKRAFPPDDPHHGLIAGLPEADYHGKPEQWHAFYYAGDVWACRGLQEIGQILRMLSSTALQQEAEQLLAAAQNYAKDIGDSIRQCMCNESGYVPPGPDQTELIGRMTQDTHASYCNYRYFPEMISAGILPPEIMQSILRWRRTHGGELLGMTRFEERLDDWPALHVARALLELDEIERYLLLLYAHGLHHSAWGTHLSYEQVRIAPEPDGFREIVAGQVLPCQAMLPIMLRWGLVYEERDAEVLWLCRAIPRLWLQPGSRWHVRRVPTRFGKISFDVQINKQGTGLFRLRLPSQPLSATIKLRLRLPAGMKLSCVRLRTVPLLLQEETAILPAGLSGRCQLDIEWRQQL